MRLTDILSQYLHEIQHEELKADEAYQAAREEKIAAERELIAAMTAKQRRLFHSYMEKANYTDVLELHHLFSRCSLLLLPQK